MMPAVRRLARFDTWLVQHRVVVRTNYFATKAQRHEDTKKAHQCDLPANHSSALPHSCLS